jgi:hypothetical protein
MNSRGEALVVLLAGLLGLAVAYAAVESAGVVLRAFAFFLLLVAAGYAIYRWLAAGGAGSSRFER